MIRLRHVEAKDLEQLRQWRNDPRLNYVFRHVWPVSEHSQIEWFEEVCRPMGSNLMLAITDDDKLIGCAGICYIDWVHRNAELSLYIGDPEPPNGAGRDACEEIKQWAFKRLNLHKLYCEVYDVEDWRIRYFKLMGMREIGRYSRHRYVNGAWVDSILMEIFNE